MDKKPKSNPSTAAFSGTSEESWVPVPNNNPRLDFLFPPQAPDELGRLGHYRVLKLLGKGGMGMVFLAEDTKLERPVALKVMLPKFAEDPTAKQRFLREAKTAAAIEHDHIVHIYQVDEDRGVPFLAMQLLFGSSLEDILQQAGSLTPLQVLHLGTQIAEGLAVAHAKSLIHRDIKPANIWIESNYGGRVKLLDFGLARSVQADAAISHSGLIIGTPAYMPPEQARGEKVDHRCDLYSLGCVLYRLATGELPIKGKDTLALLTALALHEPKPPKKINSAIPDGLNDLILMLLDKDPIKRPGSAKAVASTLRKMEQELSQGFPEVDVAAELATLARPKGSPETLASSSAFLNSPSAHTPNQNTVPDAVGTHLRSGQATQVSRLRRKPVLYILGLALIALSIAALALMVQSGNGHHGKVVAARWAKNDLLSRPLEQADGLLYTLPSKYALAFDGQSNYVELPPMNIDDTEFLTIEMDLKPTKAQVTDLLTNGAAGFIWDTKHGPPVFRFGIMTQDQGFLGVNAMVGTLPRSVVHLAGVLDREELRIYLNGKLAESKPLGGKRIARPLTPFTLGTNEWLAKNKPGSISDTDSFLNFFEGHVLRLRISKAARYQQDFTPGVRFIPDEDTIALYQFDEGQGNKLIDSSGKGHHGKIVGAKWVSGSPPDRERLLAESVLAQRGSVIVSSTQGEVGISQLAHLPSEPFTVTGITMIANSSLTDTHLEQLRGHPHLRTLVASGAPISDKGLHALSGCVNLMVLDVSNTAVGDGGFAALRDLKKLWYIGANQTALSDKGLAHLSELRNLLLLGINGSRVSAKGLDQLGPHLRYLAIENTAISLAERQALRAKRPQCFFNPTIAQMGGNENPSDRLAATLTLTRGGWVTLMDPAGKRMPVRDSALLPEGPFRLLEMHVNHTKYPLGLLTYQENYGGFHFLKGLVDLEVFNVEGYAPASDPDLVVLPTLPALKHINLAGTEASDKTLLLLKPLAKLETLNLRKTKVTPIGVKNLAASLPRCHIQSDHGMFGPPDKKALAPVK